MCHVLIIEDDALTAQDIYGTVSRVGASSVAYADTEVDALRCARESLPGVIISDVMLATGAGPLAVQAIRAELGVIPVIFITATPDQCHDCEASHILEKPFSTQALASLFRALVPA